MALSPAGSDSEPLLHAASVSRLVFVRSVEVISARGRPSLDSVTATAATITGSSTVTKSSNEAVPTGDQVGSNNAPAPQTPTRASTSTATASADSTSSSNLVQSVVAADGNLGSSSKSEIAPAADTEAEAAAPDVKQKGRSSSSPNLQQESLLAQNGPDGGTTPHSYAAAAAAGTPAAATAAAAASKPTAADSGVQANEIAVAAAAAPYLLWLEPRVGSTELPTCPVCLERLDEHISGIVMTVRGRLPVAQQHGDLAVQSTASYMALQSMASLTKQASFLAWQTWTDFTVCQSSKLLVFSKLHRRSIIR